MAQRIVLKKLLAFLFVVALPLFSFSQVGTIKGTIIDANTNEPLIGASVLIEGTTNGAAADLDGNYTIQNVKPGTYRLVASYVSYNDVHKDEVAVRSGETTTVNFSLEGDEISLQEVEVVAKANRESENILLMVQRKALLATQSVGARELSRKGISNAEAAVASMSGISKQEGVKNVFVRGLGDRYNVTQLNGFVIPSEDPQYKNIALEFFSTDVIQNISVNKVFGAGNYADVGGAGINIVSKELFADQSLMFDLSGGMNSATVGSIFLRQDGSDYFGITDDRRPVENSYNFYNTLNPSEVSLPLNHSYGISGGKSYQIGQDRIPLSFFAVASYNREYSHTGEIVRNTTTDGTIWQGQEGEKYSQSTSQLILANVSLSPKNRHHVQYNFMLVHANDQYVGDYNGYNSERFQGSPSYSGFLRRQQTNDNRLLVQQLLAGLKITEKVKLDMGLGYNTISGKEPDRRENYFSLKEDNLYDLTRSNRNKRFFSDLDDKDLGIKASLSFQLNDRSGSEDSKFTLGYDSRFVNDHFEAVEYNFSPLGMAAVSLEGLDMDALFRKNLDNELMSMAVGDNNSYKVDKQINALFAELNWRLGESLMANGGLRAEKVDLTVEHHVTHVAPGKETIRKNYLLPSINLKYDVNSKNSLRFSASKTYTLPQSKEISPYQYVNISFTDQGNPNLKPSGNYNADLKWDYYLSTGELFSATVFYKYIVDPIGRVDQGNSAGLLTYDNIAGHASVGGVEVELRKELFRQSDASHERINRFSAGMNVSYIYTDLRLNVLNTEPRRSGLEGASPLLVNADLSLQHSRKDRNFQSSLIFGYFSDRIHTIGARGYRDIMEEGVPTLDLAASYGLGGHISFKFKASNLLDSTYRLSRDSSSGGEKVILNEYRKGRNISLGISYQF